MCACVGAVFSQRLLEVPPAPRHVTHWGVQLTLRGPPAPGWLLPSAVCRLTAAGYKGWPLVCRLTAAKYKGCGVVLLLPRVVVCCCWWHGTGAWCCRQW